MYPLWLKQVGSEGLRRHILLKIYIYWMKQSFEFERCYIPSVATLLSTPVQPHVIQYKCSFMF